MDLIIKQIYEINSKGNGVHILVDKLDEWLGSMASQITFNFFQASAFRLRYVFRYE